MQTSFVSKALTAAFLIAGLSASTGAIGAPPDKGKPQVRYMPRVITVNCSGAGSELADAIAALNPVADKYVVQVSGQCPAGISLAGFASITIESVDPATPATIGPVYVDNGNNYVSIRNLILRFSGATNDNPSPIYKPSVGRLDVADVVFDCADQVEPCEQALYQVGGGDIRLYGASISGNWIGSGAQIMLDRGGVAMIAGSNNAPAGYCLPFRYHVVRGSVARILEYLGTCQSGAVEAIHDATVVYLGANGSRLSRLHVRNASVYGTTDTGINGDWFTSIQCYGPSSTVADAGLGPTNYCGY